MSEADVRDAFARQTIACRMLGSPLTADICEILGHEMQPDHGLVARKILSWPGDPFPRADAVPLRLCGGLHALVLTGQDKALAKSYAERNPSAEVLLNALITHEQHLLKWLDSPPQTNEVGRGSVIIAAARFLAERYDLPIRALELGASAGLNLNFQHFHLSPQGALPPSGPKGPDSPGIFDKEEAGKVNLCPQWEGEYPHAPFQVVAAEGVDLRPVDPARDELRLLAYCWADQTARMARLRRAIELAQRNPNPVAKGDAGEWLKDRLAQPAQNHLTLVYHTIAWQYFPPATQQTCENALQSAGAAATGHAPLAHFSMEGDGGDGAALTLRLWDGAEEIWHLGRVDFHGRWVKWKPALM